MATLKIDANIQSVRKELLNLSRELDSKLANKRIALFDSTTERVLKGELAKELSSSRSNMDKLQAASKKFAGQLSDASKSVKEINTVKNKILRVQRMMTQEMQKQVQLEKAQSALGGGGGGRGGGGGMLGGRGMGKILGRLGIAGAIIGALGGKAIISEGQKAYGTFASGVGSRQALRGRGVQDVFSTNETLRGLGYSPENVRQQRLGATDLFGRGNATTGAVTGTMEFAKAFGLDPMAIQGQMTGLSGTMGRQGAGQTFELLKKHAMLIGESMDDAVGPYLRTAADMLTQMQQTGLVMSDEALAVFSSAVSRGAPIEQVAQQLMGLQAGIQGSTGEANAFFQRVFAEAGIGKGFIGMTQAAIESGGLFGVAEERVKQVGAGSDIPMLKRLGIMGEGTGFKERAGIILEGLEDIAPGNTDKGRAAQARFFQKAASFPSMISALGAMNRLKDAKNETDPKKLAAIKKNIESLGKGPAEKMAEHLENIRKSTSGQLEQAAGLRLEMQETLGKQIAPAVIVAQNALVSIESHVSAVAGNLLGIATPAQEQAAAMSGRGTLSKSGISSMLTQAPNAGRSMLKGLTQQGAGLQLKLDRLRELPPTDATLAWIDRTVKHLENISTSIDTLIGVTGKGLNMLKRNPMGGKNAESGRTR